jgi:hypothetical protein
MTSPKRILLFETSALLGVLTQFTDPFTNTPDALERILQPLRPGAQPPIDAIKIPDHVIYELTGILPICFDTMLQKFAEAKASDDEKELTDLIEMYTLASPRGEVRDPEGRQKSHIRVLLRFIANHPDSIIHTEVSKQFCQRLKADFSVLSSSKPEVAAQYRPTFADAFQYLGDEFKAQNLRVHAGQLFMMGLISEHAFNERLGEEEKPLGHKKRFYKTLELLNKLVEPEKRTGGNGTNKAKEDHFLPRELYAYIKSEEPKRDTKTTEEQNKGYLTFGLFMRYPQLLRMALKRYYAPTQSGVAQDYTSDAELVKSAFGPSQLMLEHYLYGGMIPNDNESLLTIATAMDYDINGFTKDSDNAALRSYLDRQGFYEIRPTLADLNKALDALREIHREAPLLDRFITLLTAAEKSLQKRFNDACKNPQEAGIAKHSELRIHHIGLPYEKVFGDALVNGSLSWAEFQKLVMATDGLHQSFGSGNSIYLGTQSGDILLRQSSTPDAARILVNQDGFFGRTGKTPMRDYISNAAKTILLHDGEKHYMEVSAGELLARCRASLTDRRYATKLYRVFETMLYRPVTLDAAVVRNKAVEILGEDRLVQLEKDFANRHARKSLEVQPAYRSMFAALHTNARIARKNLGEVATAEAATALLNEYPLSHIWLANHDSDLYPHETTHDVTLENSVVRQHGGWFPAARQFNQQMTGKERMHFLNTSQLLASVDTLIGRMPRKTYADIIKDKPMMRRLSNSWVKLVNEDIQEAAQHR